MHLIFDQYLLTFYAIYLIKTKNNYHQGSVKENIAAGKENKHLITIMTVDYRSPIDRIFDPRYNELALFLMSISFILVFFTYDESQATIGKILFDRFDPRVYLFLM